MSTPEAETLKLSGRLDFLVSVNILIFAKTQILTERGVHIFSEVYRFAFLKKIEMLTESDYLRVKI